MAVYGGGGNLSTRMGMSIFRRRYNPAQMRAIFARLSRLREARGRDISDPDQIYQLMLDRYRRAQVLKESRDLPLKNVVNRLAQREQKYVEGHHPTVKSFLDASGISTSREARDRMAAKIRALRTHQIAVGQGEIVGKKEGSRWSGKGKKNVAKRYQTASWLKLRTGPYLEGLRETPELIYKREGRAPFPYEDAPEAFTMDRMRKHYSEQVLRKNKWQRNAYEQKFVQALRTLQRSARTTERPLVSKWHRTRGWRKKPES